MKHFIYIMIFCCFAISCTSVNIILKEEINSNGINEGYEFISFYRAGTTASIKELYEKEKSNFENKKVISKNKLTKLIEVLKELEWKHHFQKKITGIEKSLELCNSNHCDCLLVTRNMIVNVTRSIESHLTIDQYTTINKAINE